MSTISGVSSSTSDPWAAMKAQRSQMQAKMFAKVDTDSSGGVDATELQTVMTEAAQKTGTTVSSEETAALFKQMDSNADGSLSSDELGQGMQALMPPPPSTMDFAQSRGMGGEGGGPPPPPPPGGGGGGEGVSKASSASSSASTTYDPLDTNEDGTVSLAERLAGSTKTDPLQTLFKAMDSDSDGKISSSESNAFAKQLSDQLSQNGTTTATSSSSTTGDSTSASNDRFDLSKLARMLYDQMASGIAQTSQSTSLSALA